MSDPRTSASDKDDWLDRLLVAEAAASRDAYITDDGFTAKVMTALPPPAALPSWRRPVVVALWGVAAAGVAVAAPSAALDVAREAYRLLATVPVSLSGIAAAAATVLALTGAAAAYTLRVSD
ncbi:MAG TPA: hypothetical protein VMN56_11495 [Casimicrobiaceae bacterium]|nr:hypothetical protein [Casimicrobiaceae bacterium]